MQDFAPLLTDTDEIISHSFVSDVTLRSGRVIALITLDNGKDHTRPNTPGLVS